MGEGKDKRLLQKPEITSPPLNPEQVEASSSSLFSVSSFVPVWLHGIKVNYLSNAILFLFA